MKDIELALRYFAFKCFADKYEGNLKEFLDYTCENLNKSWEKNEIVIRQLFKELEYAITYLTNLFTHNSTFSRYTKGKCNGRFNRSIFEVLTYYFSLKEIRIAIDKKKKVFVDEFIKLNDDAEFIHAVSDTTKDVNRIVSRFTKVANILELLMKVDENNVEIPKLELNRGKIEVIKVML